jgi:hypothetical protein
MTTNDYLNKRKSEGRSEKVFCVMTKRNSPEEADELAYVEAMYKRGEVRLVREVNFQGDDSPMSYKLYRMNDKTISN